MSGPDLFGDSTEGKVRNPDIFAGRDEGHAVVRKPHRLPAPDPTYGQPLGSTETVEEQELRLGWDRKKLTPKCPHTRDLFGGDA